MAIVYRATNKVNGKVYIGQTIETINKRKWRHENMSEHPERDHHFTFHKAIRKHGVENFLWDILFESEIPEEINSKEIEFIKLYNSMGTGGYNETLGGYGRTRITIREYKVKCTECEKEFTVDYNHYKNNINNNRKFLCSKKCQSEYMRKSGRITSKGERNHRAKLSDEQINFIRQFYSKGLMTQQELADMYEVTQSHISYIISRKLRK